MEANIIGGGIIILMLFFFLFWLIDMMTSENGGSSSEEESTQRQKNAESLALTTPVDMNRRLGIPPDVPTITDSIIQTTLSSFSEAVPDEKLSDTQEPPESSPESSSQESAQAFQEKLGISSADLAEVGLPLVSLTPELLVNFRKVSMKILVQFSVDELIVVIKYCALRNDREGAKIAANLVNVRGTEDQRAKAQEALRQIE